MLFALALTVFGWWPMPQKSPPDTVPWLKSVDDSYRAIKWVARFAGPLAVVLALVA
jgi:hypothetical protein